MKLKDQLAPVGESWEITHVEIIREHRLSKNDERRYFIARAVLLGVGAIVLLLGAVGFYRNEFTASSALTGFWTAAGPIFGTIIGYYFGKTSDTS